MGIALTFCKNNVKVDLKFNISYCTPGLWINIEFVMSSFGGACAVQHKHEGAYYLLVESHSRFSLSCGGKPEPQFLFLTALFTMFPGSEDDGVTAFRILKRFHAVPTV